MTTKKIVTDTSTLVAGTLSEMIKKGKLENANIIVPKAALDELQAQASRHKDIGFQGLEEIKKIRELGKNKGIEISFEGERPTLEEIRLAKKGRIDALIRDVAARNKATLYTGDYVQALVGEAENVDVKYIAKPVLNQVKLESFFTDMTQSVHLKVGVVPMAKIGRPGEVKLEKIAKEKMTEEGIRSIISQVIRKCREDENSFIELNKSGALVVQMGSYRISIAEPPFSSGLELTAVRPIAQVSIDDYELHEELKEKIVKGSHGVLIAGPPGSGKSSFASALAKFLSSHNKVIKTFEMPRDLQVGPEVTQYGPLEGDWSKTADILLLVRPDYTIFDEIRRTQDFKVFGDMRLAGVGMVGVIHATEPVSAIQRFIGRVELGVIPHIIDTVIQINAGSIDKVYNLGLLVKVPSGMTEADLARPVVEIRDFATKKLEYEIYAYGSENVIVPVKAEKGSPLREIAKSVIKAELRGYDPKAEIEMVGDNKVIARVSSDSIAKLIGKKGQNIDLLEKRLGIRISVEPKEATLKKETTWQYQESGAFINMYVSKNLVGKQVDVYSGDDFLFSPQAGKRGLIRVKKKSDLGKELLRGIARSNIRVLA